MRHPLTERRVSLGALSIAVLGAGLGGCVGGDAEGVSGDGAAVEARQQSLERVQSAGALVIPMDTAYQDRGILRAYGLVYRLLSEGVPVRWSIAPGKEQNGVDFVAEARDLETGRSRGRVTYRGGPFIIAAEDRAAAMPIVNAWLAGDRVTVVHETTAPFAAEEAVVLTSAPRIAVALDRYQTIAFANLNAAGIPDSTGERWSAASPDLLDEDALSSGALLDADGLPRYEQAVFTYYWSNAKTRDVVRALRSWLTSSPGTHLFAQAESLRAIESDAAGRFLTTKGVIDDGFAACSVANWQPSDPLAQFHGSFLATWDVMDSVGLAPGSAWRPTTDRLLGNRRGSTGSSRVILMSGLVDGDAQYGRATYLAGFDYGFALPVSRNPWTNGVRILLNSVLASPSNRAALAPQVHLMAGAPAEVNGDEITFHLAWDNTGDTAGRAAVLQIPIPPGATLVAASAGADVDNGAVSWSLGSLRPGIDGDAWLTLRADAPGEYTAAAELEYRVGRTAHVVRLSQSVDHGGHADPPETAIDSGPPPATEETDATFAFSSDSAAATFECSLDGAAFAGCASPLSLDALAVGPHALAVRAVNRRGQVDASPAVYEWTVLPPNQLPVARDDEATVQEDGAVLIAVRANDDGGDAPVMLAEVSAPQHGSAAIVNDEVRYTPAPDFHGSDSFTYTLRDANGDRSTATVTVTVASLNDTPVAVLDTFTVPEDGGTVVLNLLANDTGLGDGPISYVSLGRPQHGTLELVGNEVRYTPNPNFNGSDVVLYTIRDADGQQSSSTVFLTITNVNDLPIARDDAFTVPAGQVRDLDVLMNDSDLDGNALSIVAFGAPDLGRVEASLGKARFTAPAGASGVTSFSYTISDGQGGFATAMVTVTIE